MRRQEGPNRGAGVRVIWDQLFIAACCNLLLLRLVNWTSKLSLG